MDNTDKKEDQYEIFRANLKIIRAWLGLSQAQFEEAYGLRKKRLNELERGPAAPSIKLLSILSKTFDTTIDDLLKVRVSLKWEEPQS